MAYYNVCPKCGANLDPGEKCDCKDSRKTEKKAVKNVNKKKKARSA